MASLSVPPSVPSPAEDCEQLHKAFEGWGTDEKSIINILAHRNAAQRKLIRQTYEETYGKTLLRDLNSELTSHFERIVMLWALDPAERDAVLADRAVKNGHPTELIEISCSRSSDQLLLVRKAYQSTYKRSLEEDVASRTKENFRKLLVPLVSTYRYEGPEVNMSLAKSEAKLLHEKISDKEYDNEEVIRILTTRSKLQIAATLNHYNDEFGHPISEDLEVDDDKFLAALSAIVGCLTVPEKYFEGVIRGAINRRGTDEDSLTRVVATRTEVDMERIKEEYYRRNSVHLAHAIKKDTHGDYEDMLLALVGEENA